MKVLEESIENDERDTVTRRRERGRKREEIERTLRNLPLHNYQKCCEVRK